MNFEIINNRLNDINEELKSFSRCSKKIALRDKSFIYFVNIADIIRCEALGAYTQFKLSGKESIITSETLKKYEEMLIPFGFVRIHHSHIINLNKVIRYDKKNGGRFLLENNDMVPISFRKRSNLAKIIDRICSG